RSAFVAKDLVTVEARVGDDVADIADRFLISSLRCPIGSLSRFGKFVGELQPIGIIDGDGLPVLATAAGSQHQRRRFGQSDSGIVHDLPSWIEIAAPKRPVKTATGSCAV